MDSTLDDLPADYFSSTKARFNKNRRRSSNKSRRFLAKASKKMKESEKKKCSWIICMVNTVNVVIVMALLVSFLYRKYVDVKYTSCPFGFVGDSCQRDDYIDVISWSSSDPFEAEDATCTNGYSFRMWAPGAYEVRLSFKNPVDSVFSYYSMKEQDNGFWYVFLCNCMAGAQYKYLVDYHSSQDGYSLSLGSLERTPFSQEVSNIIVDTNDFDESMFYVPVPPNPVIYQIHVPTYTYQKKESYINPLYTIKHRLQTMALGGINTLELNGLEFLNCDENKETCWNDSSYSPGLLRPSLSNTTSLRELIHEIHKHSMSVIIDLNWESFKRSTLFGSYHGYYAKYLEKNSNSSSEIKDVFRESRYCKDEKCPLEMKNSDLNILVLYSVLQRYRTVFMIDGIRWIANECNQFVGGDCSGNEEESIPYDYDFWKIVKDLGFTILTSKPSSVPSYDYYLDTSLCPVINSVHVSSSLHSVLKQVIETAIAEPSNALLTLECMENLPSRLFIRSQYKITSMLLSLFYLLPTHLHFFMGSVYMSDTPFVKDPEILDVDNVGYYIDGSWFAPSNKFLRYKMSVAANSLRQNYLINNQMELLVDDQERQFMALKTGNDTFPLLVLINYSRNQYLSTTQLYNLTIPSIHPSYVRGPWRFVYTTASSQYDTGAADIGSDLTFVECSDNVDVRVEVCYNVAIGEQSLNVYVPIIE